MIYLQTKFVEEIVDEILDTVYQSIIQMCSRDIMENGFSHRRGKVISTSVVLLVAVDCDFESQNSQHQ